MSFKNGNTYGSIVYTNGATIPLNNGYDQHRNGNIVVMENYEYGTDSLPKKVVYLEENGKTTSTTKRRKRPSSLLYFQTPVGRYCFYCITIVLTLVLLCLLIGAILFILYFYTSQNESTGNNEIDNAKTFNNDSLRQIITSTESVQGVFYANFTTVTSIEQTTNGKSVPTIDPLNNDGDFFIKVSLYDPKQALGESSTADHSKLPLTNLTRVCHQAKGQCWYHADKYPETCKVAYCRSTEYEVSWNNSVNSMHFAPVANLHKLDTVPDRTPCGHRSWCLGGECVKSDDPRLWHYDNLPPVKGNWENNCESPKCLVNGFSRKSDWSLLLMGTKCPGMPCSAYTTEIRRLQFRSCTNPLPAQGGAGCNAKDLPVLWGPICQDCPTMLAGNEARKLWPNDVLHALCGNDGRFLNNDRCSCIRSNGQVERVDEGAPCRSKFNESRTEPGHCFYGICLNYVGFNRQCTFL